jgi:hypothetical protein
VSEINKHSERIRNDFLHTLSHWPGRPSAPEELDPPPPHIPEIIEVRP